MVHPCIYIYMFLYAIFLLLLTCPVPDSVTPYSEGATYLILIYTMSITKAAVPVAAHGGYDRRRELLQAFDDTKAGVKGLVDAGVTTIPAIFRHHRQHGPQVSSSSSSSGSNISSIPVIDLSAASAAEAGAREEVVAQVKAAAETVGFFQLVNHGVPDELLSEMLASVRRFNEAPPEAKLPYYTRDSRRKLRFNSNFDLFQSPAANWRDTLFCEAAPEPPRAEELPPAVRHVMLEYGGAAREVAARVLALLSEALGLSPGHLAGMGCARRASAWCATTTRRARSRTSPWGAARTRTPAS